MALHFMQHSESDVKAVVRVDISYGMKEWTVTQLSLNRMGAFCATMSQAILKTIWELASQTSLPDSSPKLLQIVS